MRAGGAGRKAKVIWLCDCTGEQLERGEHCDSPGPPEPARVKLLGPLGGADAVVAPRPPHGTVGPVGRAVSVVRFKHGAALLHVAAVTRGAPARWRPMRTLGSISSLPGRAAW
jgi:hypothetical protein